MCPNACSSGSPNSTAGAATPSRTLPRGKPEKGAPNRRKRRLVHPWNRLELGVLPRYTFSDLPRGSSNINLAPKNTSHIEPKTGLMSFRYVGPPRKRKSISKSFGLKAFDRFGQQHSFSERCATGMLRASLHGCIHGASEKLCCCPNLVGSGNYPLISYFVRSRIFSGRRIRS